MTVEQQNNLEFTIDRSNLYLEEEFTGEVVGVGPWPTEILNGLEDVQAGHDVIDDLATRGALFPCPHALPSVAVGSTSTVSGVRYLTRWLSNFHARP